MSLQSMLNDPEYRQASRDLRAIPLDVSDPALADGRVAARHNEIVQKLAAIARRHGWNPATESFDPDEAA